MKQAKGFSLSELDQKDKSFDLSSQQEQNKIDQSEDIILEIGAGERIIPVKKPESEFQRLLKNLKTLYKSTAGKSINIKVSLDEKSVFYELMSTMLAAGISIVQGLNISAKQATSKQLQSLLESLATQVEQGKKFSEALEYYPKVFSQSEVGMLQSGEMTGQLSEVMQRLAVEIKKGIAVRSKVKSAMIYPIVVVVFVVLTVYAMLTFVIPQVKTLFEGMNTELPALTLMLLDASDFVQQYGGLIFLGIIGIIFALFSYYKTPKGKLLFHFLFLKIPVVKDFIMFLSQATFARSLANLLSSGVSIVEALGICSTSMGNLVYANVIKLMQQDVKKGIKLEEVMQGSPYFSSLTVNMFAVGEKTAKLDELALQVANYYDTKSEKMADNLSKLIQPLIIGIVGGIVGVVVLAIMLPMTKLLSAVGTL